jgi:DNA-binding NarL/FixJ family response regulator
VRILLADDQPKVRSALRLLLGQQADVEVVGEAGEAKSLLILLDNIHPDVILLDWELPGMLRNGRFAMLRTRHPGLKVLVLSGRPEARRAALDAGADAFVSKVEPPERLLDALSAIGGEMTDCSRPRTQKLPAARQNSGT